jgi:hypothetical protein
MRLNTLRLIGALTVAAVPVTASAASPQLYNQHAASAQQDMPAAVACAPGWYWEPAGYATHGKFRPAHCARRY